MYIYTHTWYLNDKKFAKVHWWKKVCNDSWNCCLRGRQKSTKTIYFTSFGSVKEILLHFVYILLRNICIYIVKYICFPDAVLSLDLFQRPEEIHLWLRDNTTAILASKSKKIEGECNPKALPTTSVGVQNFYGYSKNQSAISFASAAVALNKQDLFVGHAFFLLQRFFSYKLSKNCDGERP